MKFRHVPLETWISKPSEYMDVEANNNEGDKTMETNDRTDQSYLNKDMMRETIKGHTDETLDYTPKSRVDGGTELESMNEVDKLLNRLGVLSELANEGCREIRTALKNTVEELQMLDVFIEGQYMLLKNYTSQLFKDA